MHFKRQIFFIVSFLFCVCSNIIQAQNIPVRTLPSEIFITVRQSSKDTVQWRWKYGGRGNLNFSQSSLSHWAGGGDDFAMSISSYLNIFAYYKKGNNNWDTNIDFNLGYISTSSAAGRKNDDRLVGRTKYGYKIDSAGNLFASFLINGRSQMFDGRKYFQNDSSTLISSFMSPGYAVISAGLDYKPANGFSLFVSPLTTRLTVILNKKLAAKGGYGLNPGHRYKFAPGAFASINYSTKIFKNVDYKTNLNMFSDYSHKPQNIDIDMSNFVNFKINKYMSATYSLDLIYDDDVRLFGSEGKSAALQVKSVIGIGFSMPFKTGYVRSM